MGHSIGEALTDRTSSQSNPAPASPTIYMGGQADRPGGRERKRRKKAHETFLIPQDRCGNECWSLHFIPTATENMLAVKMLGKEALDAPLDASSISF